MKLDDIMALADAYAHAYSASGLAGSQSSRAALKDAIKTALDTEKAVYDEAAALCAKLSPRQRELLIFSAKGYGSKEVGEMWGIGREAVQNYRAEIRKRIGVGTLIEAAVVAAKARII